ncbi:helix-turn-helix domain-containing protein [Luteolibacter yonseiensis]|uniref:DNA-3-methyladenine glycosylase II n=1 Tax=Luteolibacter yonseiensis TaxID=1144680 RepID=A0A934R6M8_9BACT|nr:AlkA N-terminal domain-containing protein [Luteolibacter yonseiensis]MBK1816943.1 helix-turn-helix domain-containing protein [Luteolibacter yonseiensis]
MIDDHAAYNAMTSRDPRFDGVFYVGVTSTGIYCRPICPVKTPKLENCRFFASAEAAEEESFRPCLRCRPELAPGNAPVDSAHRIAHLIVHRIGEGLVDDGLGLEEIALQFGISSRQLRRIVQAELGVSPIQLVQTRRLLLAKQLLTETKLPVIDIAFASGFSSLRRFNDAFSSRYRMPPTRLRKEASSPSGNVGASETSTLQLSYRPPYDWEGMLAFLAARTIKGVELVTLDSYSRTVRLGGHVGWIRVTHAPARHAVMVEFTHTLTPVLPALLGRLRNLFDLSARPDLICAHLMKDKRLKKAVLKNPGQRVPGAFDGFEMVVRAILGQQITVKAATTLSCRFAEAFGEEITTPFPDLCRLSPFASAVAGATVDDVAKLGIVSARAKSIIAIARAFHSGEVKLDAGADPEQAMRQLVALPGIGPWTAHYIAMRGLNWPDAFPKEDIAVRNNLGGVTAKQAEAMSQAWRPWRSYAVMHIWRNPA